MEYKPLGTPAQKLLDQVTEEGMWTAHLRTRLLDEGKQEEKHSCPSAS